MEKKRNKPTIIRQGCVTAAVGVILGVIVVAQLAGGVGAFVMAVRALYLERNWLSAAGATAVAVLFGSVGFALLTAIVIARRARSAAGLNLDVPDDQPWLERPEWATNQIRAVGGSALLAPVLGVIALWCNIATLPLLATLPTYLSEATSAWRWLALLTPVPGLLLLAAFFYQFFRQQKFGNSMLELANVPGVIGGQLAGVLRIPARLPEADAFRLRLRCEESRFSGKRDGVVTVVLWQQEQVVTEPQHEGLETCVPVLFAIPFSAPESSRLGDDGEIVWHLEVWARLPGIDYAAKFKVPVFKTADSREDFQSEETDAARIVPSASNELVLRDAGIIREEMPDGGVRLTFRAARNGKSALFISVFPLVFGPVAFAILKFDKDAANLFNVPRIWQRADSGLVGFAVAAGRTLLVVVIGLTAAVILIGITVWALDLWLYRSVVEASRRGLTVRGGWLGIGRTRSFAADDIRQFKTQEYMSSSSGSVWKSIVVVPKAGKGKMRAVGKGIDSKLAQKTVIDELNAALGRTA